MLYKKKKKRQRRIIVAFTTIILFISIVPLIIIMSNKNKTIDLLEILQKTKYGTDGIGGIITNGTMYVGYPR